jgi:hypothetical protein
LIAAFVPAKTVFTTYMEIQDFFSIKQKENIHAMCCFVLFQATRKNIYLKYYSNIINLITCIDRHVLYVYSLVSEKRNMAREKKNLRI